MTTPSAIRDKIWYGYGKVAQHVGFPHQQYRPTSANDPLAPFNLIGTLNASFAIDAKYLRPNTYKNAIWRISVDARYTKVGDYFVADRTYFMINQHAMLPPEAVRCNGIVSLSLPGGQATVAGKNNYGGSTIASQKPYALNWPASILIHGRGRDGEVDLPGDIRNPWWDIYLPAIPNVTIKSRDIVTDQMSPVRRFVVSTAELTSLGWRLECEQAVP